MAEPLYKRFGGGAPDPGNLVQGQQAVNNSFKDALSGVDKLLKTVEQGYVEDNTLKVQDYLKSNIRNAGIGADAPEMDSIKGRFGKLINTEALDKTITSTREKMFGEARDEASMEAGKAFGETEDIAAAGNAFKQKFLALGGKENQATQEMSKWRQDNQFLAQDIETKNNLAIDAFTDEVVGMTRQDGGVNTPADIINSMANSLPDKLKTKAIVKARDTVEALQKLDSNQQDAHAYLSAKWNNEISAKEAEISARQAQAKAAAEAVTRVPQSAYDAVEKLNGTLGGLGEAVKNDATGSYLTSSFLSSLFDKSDGKEEEAATQILQQNIDQLLEYGIPPKEAQAIGYQAYQDARAESGNRFGGVTIDANTLDKHFNKYAQSYDAKVSADAQYTKSQEAAIKERTALTEARDAELFSFLKDAKLANISGKDFDIDSYIKGKSAAVNPVTGMSPASSTSSIEATPKAAAPTTITPNLIKQRADENAARSKTSDAEATKKKLKAAVITDPIVANQVKNVNGDGLIDLISAPARGLRNLRSWMQNGGANDFGPQKSKAAQNLDPGRKEFVSKLVPPSTEATTPIIKNPILNKAISKVTSEYGLPPTMLATWAMIESNGNVNAFNESSSANGPFQFVPSSAKAYNISGKETDPAAATKAAARMAKDNAVELSDKGIEPTELNLYLAHQQGAAGLTAIYNSIKTGEPLSKIRVSAIKANLPGKFKHLAKDPKAFLEYWNGRYTEVQQQVAGNS